MNQNINDGDSQTLVYEINSRIRRCEDKKTKNSVLITVGILSAALGLTGIASGIYLNNALISFGSALTATMGTLIAIKCSKGNSELAEEINNLEYAMVHIPGQEVYSIELQIKEYEKKKRGNKAIMVLGLIGAMLSLYNLTFGKNTDQIVMGALGCMTVMAGYIFSIKSAESLNRNIERLNEEKAKVMCKRMNVER